MWLYDWSNFIDLHKCTPNLAQLNITDVIDLTSTVHVCIIFGICRMSMSASFPGRFSYGLGTRLTSMYVCMHYQLNTSCSGECVDKPPSVPISLFVGSQVTAVVRDQRTKVRLERAASRCSEETSHPILYVTPSLDSSLTLRCVLWQTHQPFIDGYAWEA